MADVSLRAVGSGSGVQYPASRKRSPSPPRSPESTACAIDVEDVDTAGPTVAPPPDPSGKGKARAVPGAALPANGVAPAALKQSLAKVAEEQEKVEENADYQMVGRAVRLLRQQLAQAEDDLDRLQTLKQTACGDVRQFVAHLLDPDAPSPLVARVPRRQKVIVVPPVNLSRYNRAPDAVSDEQFHALLGLPPPGTPGQAAPAAGVVYCELRPHYSRPTSPNPWPRDAPLQLATPPASPLPTRSSAAAESSAPAANGAGNGVNLLTRPTGTHYSNRISGARYVATPRVRMGAEAAPESSSAASATGIPAGVFAMLDAEVRAMLSADPSLAQAPVVQKLVALARQRQQLLALEQPSAAVPPPPAAVRAMYKPAHHGFSCDGCGASPILGTRHHCSVCSEVDLCSGCADRGWSGGGHLGSHGLEAVEFPSG